MTQKSRALALLITLGIFAMNAQAAQTEGEKLNATITSYTVATKKLDAFVATYYDVEEDLDKFGDYGSPEYFQRSKKIYENALEQLKGIHAEHLSSKDQRTFKLFKEDMEVSVKRFDFPLELLDFNQMDNRLHTYLDDSSEALTYFPFDSVKHYDAFVKRSEGFPAYVDRQIELFKKGMKQKIVLNCMVASKTLNTYQEGLETNVEKNPFFRPIGFMPKKFSEKDRLRLTADFKKMISERIIPGYTKFDRFFRNEYMPACRKEYGISSLPQGKQWYSYMIRARTNLDMDAQQIHEIGLKEVARISAEMDSIQKQLKIKGDRKQFLHTLTHDDKYFFKSSKEMFGAFEKVKAKVTLQIPKYFRLVPKSDYKIVDSSNPEDAAGSYRQPSENQPYGRFVVNTANLRAVPSFGVTTLSLHEAVPGHHFQLALQFEMKDQLSEYQRKVYDSTSFVEGWALYAEYLGREMGMFTDPLQRLGNLNDEMLRAVRLVVDTGIHSLDWKRDEVIAYMNRYLASDAKDIETEADRYSVWPGQALAYKLGQLKIIELRKLAEKELGKKFDIREYHRVVIGNGTVSLGILENQVKEWIDSVKAATPGHT